MRVAGVRGPIRHPLGVVRQGVGCGVLWVAQASHVVDGRSDRPVAGPREVDAVVLLAELEAGGARVDDLRQHSRDGCLHHPSSAPELRPTLAPSDTGRRII